MTELLIDAECDTDDEDCKEGAGAFGGEREQGQIESERVRRQLCMKTVDIYSVMNELDKIKHERDEWYALHNGYMMANAGQNSQSFSLEKSIIVKSNAQIAP
jgi:hypothetical protein